MFILRRKYPSPKKTRVIYLVEHLARQDGVPLPRQAPGVDAFLPVEGHLQLAPVGGG